MREGIEHSKQSFAKMSDADQAALGKELQDVEQALAGALRARIDPAAAGVGALIRRHHAWVAAMWGRACSAEAYCGLADLYLGHPDFVARYEGMEPGFAQYLAHAMKLHANR